MENRLIYDMSDATYRTDPCVVPSLTASCAKALVKRSPAHALINHPRAQELTNQPVYVREYHPSEALETGTIIHGLMLGNASDILEQVDAKDWRTKAAKEERDRIRSEGKTPVLVKQMVKASNACQMITARLKDMGLEHYVGGETEVTAMWAEESDQQRGDVMDFVQCRGRMDLLSDDMTVITDLKTCESAHPKVIQRKIADFGYDVQAAAYVSGLEHIHPELQGRVQFRFLFMELSPPYSVTPVMLAGTYIALGISKWRRAVNLWAKCVAEQRWPAYTEDVVRVEASKWAMEEEYEEEDD